MQIQLSNIVIKKIETIGDGSVKLKIETRELPPDEMAKMFRALNKEEVDVLADFAKPEGKSKSERLRAVLYRFWEQHKKQEYKDFDLFYDVQMERYIETVKEKLN